MNQGSAERIPIARDGDASTTFPPEYWVGKYLGPYRVERELARGGMGVVLLGLDEALRRRVAIKVMGSEIANDAESVKRFEREARATASVQHPGIAQVYLVGLSEEGVPFMAMEFLEGGSVRDLIKSRQRMPYSVVTAWMEQVADALRAAQKMNIIHRDIKPANLMITAQGTVKVVDFGLAKIFFEDSYRAREGSVLGTPSYMAPEQGQGRVVDHRADIYSLGATFYHLLTGRPPFEADSPVQIMMKHVTAPLVPMKTLVSSIPIELDDIVGRCMRKDVDERYQEYESLLYDLKRIRLMFTTREQGAMVSGEDDFPPAPPSPGGRLPDSLPSGTCVLPPPPSSIMRGPAAPKGDRIPAPGAPVRPPDPPSVIDRDSSSVGPVPILLGAGAGLILLIGIIGFLTKKPKEDRSGGGRAALSVWLEKAAENARNRRQGAAAGDFDVNYLAYLATLESLESLRVGLANHELSHGEFPRRIQEFATEDKVLITFDFSNDGVPLDGWGTPIRYETRDHHLVSAGIDRLYNTSDDLIMTVTGINEVPTVYQRLEEKE